MTVNDEEVGIQQQQQQQQQQHQHRTKKTIHIEAK